MLYQTAHQVFVAVAVVVQHPGAGQVLPAFAAVPFRQCFPAREAVLVLVVQQHGLVLEPELADIYDTGFDGIVQGKALIYLQSIRKIQSG